MAIRADVVLVTIELLLFAYILTDFYASMFGGGLNDVVAFPEDIAVRSNTTTDDPRVIELGSFAVAEYKRHTDNNLRFESVVRIMHHAESAYVILLRATEGSLSESKLFAAMVMRRQGKNMALVAFEEYDGRSLDTAPFGE